jgi:hypothetical protein
MVNGLLAANSLKPHAFDLPPFPLSPLSLRAMTQEQIKDMRDRVVVLRRFL